MPLSLTVLNTQNVNAPTHKSSFEPATKLPKSSRDGEGLGGCHLVVYFERRPRSSSGQLFTTPWYLFPHLLERSQPIPWSRYLADCFLYQLTLVSVSLDPPSPLHGPWLPEAHYHQECPLKWTSVATDSHTHLSPHVIQSTVHAIFFSFSPHPLILFQYLFFPVADIASLLSFLSCRKVKILTRPNILHLLLSTKKNKKKQTMFQISFTYYLDRW